MTNYHKKSLTELYELLSIAVDNGETEQASELQEAIRYVTAFNELFHYVVTPQLKSHRKRSGKRTSQHK